MSDPAQYSLMKRLHVAGSEIYITKMTYDWATGAYVGQLNFSDKYLLV